jgi:hypothetical protein
LSKENELNEEIFIRSSTESISEKICHSDELEQDYLIVDLAEPVFHEIDMEDELLDEVIILSKIDAEYEQITQSDEFEDVEVVTVTPLPEPVFEELPKVEMEAEFNELVVILQPLAPVFERFWHVDIVEETGFII